MRTLLLAVAGAVIVAPGSTRPAPVSPVTLLPLETSFDLLVHAPYAEAAPLFGPEGERAWAGSDWDPAFVYPQPARDQQGAVFTVHKGSATTVWVNTLLDREARHFQYVYFRPEIMVTVIDVRFEPADADSTTVHVNYARTALTIEGNEHVAAMSEHDKKAGTEWQQAINAYLAGRKH
ncbi:MAG: hypothetical protein ABSD59_12200 [Terracidiphilus sp.]|jgi:hypothetical protein